MRLLGLPSGRARAVRLAGALEGRFVPKEARHAHGLSRYGVYRLVVVTGVRQRPSKTGWVVTQIVTREARSRSDGTAEGPGPRGSTADHLSRPDYLLRPLGVQARPLRLQPVLAPR